SRRTALRHGDRGRERRKDGAEPPGQVGAVGRRLDVLDPVDGDLFPLGAGGLVARMKVPHVTIEAGENEHALQTPGGRRAPPAGPRSSTRKSSNQLVPAIRWSTARYAD